MNEELKKRRLEFEKALLALDRLAARSLILEAAKSFEPIAIAEQLITPALESIGTGWEDGRVALSQVYMSGRICEELVDIILPPADPRRKGQPTMAIGCLEDHHSLGKRIVYSILRAGGFELKDYGHGIEAGELVRRASEDGVRILLISVLMLRSALKVKEVREGINARSPAVQIVVGGAPFIFDNDLWKEVGADAMGQNASEALELVSGLMGARQ